MQMILVFRGVLEPVNNDSAEDVHQSYERIIKVTWYRNRSSQTLQSKHSAQRRYCETDFHSEKRENVVFMLTIEHANRL
jgi:hypothetical protein